MSEEFEGWNTWLEGPCLFWEPGDHNYRTPKFNPEKAIYTPEQEHERIKEEVLESDGFDIDFDCFRCVFNYHRAYLDSHEFVDKPETTGDLLERLSKEALDGYNGRQTTKFEFARVVKANFHYSAGFMFLITFEARDPYDGLVKPFQARVRHLKHTFTEHVFCRTKPNVQVEYFGNAKTDVEKT